MIAGEGTGDGDTGVPPQGRPGAVRLTGDGDLI